MNVNPIITSGPASTSQAAIRAESQPVSTSTSGRGDARQRITTSTAEPKNSEAGADQAGSADRKKMEQLKAFISDDNVRLSTYRDKDSGHSVLEVRDQTTGDVINQYPSEELIRLYASMRQSLVDQSA